MITSMVIPMRSWAPVIDLFGHHLVLFLGQMDPYDSRWPSTLNILHLYSLSIQMKSRNTCYQDLILDPCILVITIPMVVVLIKKAILNKLH